MYTDYFGFNENPFSIAPNPRYLYMSTMHQEALAHLVYGTTSKGCIVLLTGEIGTGKTTISRYFLEKLPRSTDIAVIMNPKLTGYELLASVCDEFQIKVTIPEPTSKNYIDSLNEFLLKAYSANRQAVLVIDEAQNLDLDVLEMLRLLTNLETDQQKLLKIVLLGQSELRSILARPELEQINQRITSRYHLKGLKRADVEAYIAHRIMVAGGGRSTFFTSRALIEIYRASRGIPRLINSLCDHSLLAAYSQDKEQVDKKIVQKAAAEIFGNDGLGPDLKFSFRLILTTGIILMVVFLGLWFGSSFLLDAWNGLDRESQLKKLSELGKQEEPVKLLDPEKMSGPDLQSEPERLPAMIESTDQAEISLEQSPVELPEPTALQNNEADQESLSGRTNIVISPIEINE
jgi:type II secretory pathway predicted ATPase ExeA